MKINHPQLRLKVSSMMICLMSLFITPVTANQLFDKGNESLAHGDAQAAIDAYLTLADADGTSPALAENIAAAAELAKEPGLIEWAQRTTLLRNTEWGIITATALALIWALSIAFGSWKRWPIKTYLLASLPCIIGIAASLWAVRQWMPPANEAIIVTATPVDLTTESSTEKIDPHAKILLSPFSSAEEVATLPLGAHVLLTPTPESSSQPPENYIYITHPDTQIKGWVHSDAVRQVGYQK